MNSLADKDRYQQKSGLIMANIYLAILKKIKRQQYPVLQQRITINPFQKLWIAWITAYKENKRENQIITNSTESS
jgi:phytoene synthase